MVESEGRMGSGHPRRERAAVCVVLSVSELYRKNRQEEESRWSGFFLPVFCGESSCGKGRIRKRRWNAFLHRQKNAGGTVQGTVSSVQTDAEGAKQITVTSAVLRIKDGATLQGRGVLIYLDGIGCIGENRKPDSGRGRSLRLFGGVQSRTI